MELFLSICLGVGLAACSGFRVFVPLLMSALAIHFGLVSVSDGFEWMGTWMAIGVLGIATILEIGGYYIPWIDNLLDTIATPAAVAAGTLLTTSFVKIDDPILQWGLGLIMGGGTAGFIQVGTGLLRLASSKFTGGIANPAISTAENVLSVGFSLVSFWLPVAAFVMVVLFIMWLIRKLLARNKTSNQTTTHV